MSRHSAPSAPLSWLAIVARPAGALARRIGRILTAFEHRREVRQLAELDDRILKDIGLSRGDVETALLEPMFRNPSVLLVRSSERHRRVQATRPGGRAVRPTVPVTGNGAL